MEPSLTLKMNLKVVTNRGKRRKPYSQYILIYISTTDDSLAKEYLVVCKKVCNFAADFKKYKNAIAKNEHIIDVTFPRHRRLWTDLLC